MKNDEKTIPYRLSTAELESLQILRKKTNPSSFNQKDVEEELLDEIIPCNSDLKPKKQMGWKNIP